MVMTNNKEVKAILKGFDLVGIGETSLTFRRSTTENGFKTDNVKSWWIIDIARRDYWLDQLLKLAPMRFSKSLDAYIIGIDWADATHHPITGGSLTRKPWKINGDTATIRDLLNGIDIVYIPYSGKTYQGFGANWFLSNMDKEQADIISQFLPVKYHSATGLYMFGTSELQNNGYPVKDNEVKKNNVINNKINNHE